MDLLCLMWSVQYDCTNWFAYESDANYPTRVTLEWNTNPTFNTSECFVSSSNNNNGGNSGGNVQTGDRTETGTDSESKNQMSSGAKAVLWIILSIFMVLCVAAACYFAYHWKQKHNAELKESMSTNSPDPSAPPEDGNTLQSVASTSTGNF